MPFTPAEFGHALLKASKGIEEREAVAIAERAKITKERVLGAAAAVRHFGPVKPGWVRYTIEGAGRSAAAKVRLVGGFAVLTERGSYKHPGGWQEIPKAGKRARARARRKQGLKRGVSGPTNLTGVSGVGVLGSVAHGFGPVRSVHHTPFSPRPFFRVGVDLARPESLKAYDRSIRDSLWKALR